MFGLLFYRSFYVKKFEVNLLKYSIIFTLLIDVIMIIFQDFEATFFLVNSLQFCSNIKV